MNPPSSPNVPNYPIPFEPSLEYDGSRGWERGVGHVKGSDTSEAWAKVETRRSPTLQLRVLSCIGDSGEFGCTSAEVEDRLDGKHQSISSSIRNLELGGRLAKTDQIRNNQHAYVTTEISLGMAGNRILPPNPRRVSYKKKYDGLRSEIEAITRSMAESGYGGYWYRRLLDVLERN